MAPRNAWAPGSGSSLLRNGERTSRIEEDVMKRILSLASFALMVSLFAAGCGDSSPAAPTEPENLSANVAGTWSGQTTIFGVKANVTVLISQAQSDPSMSGVVALTGHVNINNGTAVPATGTKQGNTWSMSGNSGAT